MKVSILRNHKNYIALLDKTLVVWMICVLLATERSHLSHAKIKRIICSATLQCKSSSFVGVSVANCIL